MKVRSQAYIRFQNQSPQVMALNGPLDQLMTLAHDMCEQPSLLLFGRIKKLICDLRAQASKVSEGHAEVINEVTFRIECMAMALLQASAAHER